MSNKLLYFILLINLIIYLIVILLYPHFMSDDFMIFARIKQNPGEVICLNPNEVFFLFSRPVSYFSFWLDYHIFYDNAIGMKFVSLLIDLGLISVIYKIIQNLSLFLKKEIDQTVLFICLLLFTLHLDVLNWIYWISDRTELLSLFFYAFALLYLSKYLIIKKNYYLYFLVLFYLLSILSKQQGAHLPVLVLFIYFLFRFRKKIDSAKDLLLTTIVMFIIMLGYSITSFIYYSNDLEVEKNIFKKPFSLVGNILNTSIPLLSWRIYNFFILDKELALVIAISISFVIILLLSLKKVSLEKTFVALAFLMIISYPRILAVGNQRINGVYLFWMILSIYFFIIYKYKIYKYTKITLILALLFYSYSFVKRVNDDLVIQKKYNREVVELSRVVNKKPHELYTIITAETSANLPYNLYFYKYHNFGYDSTLRILPFSFDRTLIYYDLNRYDKNLIVVQLKGDSCCVQSKDDLLYVSLDKKNKLLKRISILKEEKSISGREYNKICFKEEGMGKRNLIYNNGVKWIEL